MQFSQKGGFRMSRRITCLILCCILLLSCAVTAYAETAAVNVTSYSTVTSNGECQVSITVTIRLEEAVSNLSFPLPREAQNVKKDGSMAHTTKTANATLVDLSSSIGNLIGTFTMRFEYTLPNAVKNVVDEEGKSNLVLELPLLSGFAYPVESLDYTVTLPGQIENTPNYTSIYHQESIKSYLTSAVNGNMISGSIRTLLEDHEEFTMTLDVPEEMFPSVSTYHRVGNPEIVPMCIIAAVALLYWLIFLRTFPVFPQPQKAIPTGLNAGEIGCRLTLTGADLTMMVFTWGQLGYLTIELNDKGRVFLHKRMEMGNERSLFEVRIFRTLFKNRSYVEATSSFYAKLSRRTAAMIPGDKSMLLPASGNMTIFRFICCSIHIFGGICLAMNITSLGVLQVLLSIALAGVGVLAAWLIQAAVYRIHLREYTALVVGIIAFVIWNVLGLLAGQILITLVTGLVQILAGIAAAYGGRRSEVGRQNLKDILGLRKFLKDMPKEELQQLRRSDPDFFYNMAPYAMALGLGKQFAQQFNDRPIGPCPYLTTNIQGRLNAQDWMLIMQETAGAMDSLRKRMDMERWSIIQVR